MRTHHYCILVFLLLLSSCNSVLSIFAEGHKWDFYFHNNSNEEIGIIVDLEPDDLIITPDSRCYRIRANYYMIIGNRQKWSSIVKDSIHIFVLDSRFYASAPITGGGGYITKELIETISEDMILERMTIFHNDFKDEDKSIPEFYYNPTD